jgi:hypothetical protein
MCAAYGCYAEARREFMIKIIKTGLAIAAAIAVASCSVGSDKCGEGYIEKLGACQKGSATGGKKSTAIKDADLDGLADETVTGLGETCKSQPECAGKGADYCMIDPTNGIGTCSIKDCTVSPNSCPGEYTCCQLPAELKYPVMCIPPDVIGMMRDVLGYCKE